MAKRHTLWSLFRDIFRPFTDAWRDEFGTRPAAQVARCLPKRDDQNADFGTPGEAKAQETQVADGDDQVSRQPAAPVLAVAPGQTWREAVAERLAAEPAGLRAGKPAAKTTPATRKTKPAPAPAPKRTPRPVPKGAKGRKGK